MKSISLKLPVVIPAKAGTQLSDDCEMGPGFRRDDETWSCRSL